MKFGISEERMRLLGLSNARRASQGVFLGLFVFLSWASWTSRLQGYPVSRFLEIDPLVSLSTALSTGYLYRFLGWSLLTVFLTLLFGRVFCGWVCPMGTLNHFIRWVYVKTGRRETIEKNRYSRHQLIKYFILGIFLVTASLGSLQTGLLDPLAFLSRAFGTVVAPAWDYFTAGIGGALRANPWHLDLFTFAPGTAGRIFTGSFWTGLLFLALLGANILRPRFFCRFLCPLGALLGILSRFSIFRISRDIKKCTDCDLCLTGCEGASDPQGKVRMSECVSCMNCLDDCRDGALMFSKPGPGSAPSLHRAGMTRRELLLSGITGLIAFPMLRNNGGINDENYSAELIRPPGSVEEYDFMKKCIKCGQCMDICPTNVLQPAALREGGFEALWTPVMKFNINHCQLKCTLCSEVCPTGAIRKISVTEKLGMGDFARKGPVVIGTAFIDRSRCLPWANQIPCVVCEEVCPTAPKAIQTRDEEARDVFSKIVTLNHPFIVPDLCIGCGICQARCPVSDRPAVYVTAVGENRSDKRRLLLKNRGTGS